MIPRYENPDISIIWSNETKLGLWLKTELAAIEARANLGLIERSVSEKISEILLSKSIDIEWWLNRD